MKKFQTLAITSPSFCKNKTLLQEASELTDRLVVNDTGATLGAEAVGAWINESRAEAIIIGTDALPEDTINSLQHVKAVGKYGVGCDNINLPALRQRGIFFGWEGGVNRRSVSELVLCFMLGHCRNIFRVASKMQRGVWDKDGGHQLSNKTIGIVGLGYIGVDVATLLKGFGCNVLAFDIVDKYEIAKDLGVLLAKSYRELIANVDVLTFHVPGGVETKNLFGPEEIELARENLLVINTARGQVVDFSATTAAVRNGRLAGYATDVYPSEPFRSTEFSVEQGFYFTPHIGGNAEEAVLAMGRAAIKGLKDYLMLSQ